MSVGDLLRDSYEQCFSLEIILKILRSDFHEILLDNNYFDLFKDSLQFCNYLYIRLVKISGRLFFLFEFKRSEFIKKKT